MDHRLYELMSDMRDELIQIRQHLDQYMYQDAFPVAEPDEEEEDFSSCPHKAIAERPDETGEMIWYCAACKIPFEVTLKPALERQAT